MNKFVLSTLAIFGFSLVLQAKEPAQPPLVMVVLDPLSAELSCPCVEGHAQRNYAKLAKHLEEKIGRTIKLVFAESLAIALEKKTEGKADIVIGKDSVIKYTSKQQKLALTGVLSLTGRDGSTLQKGLVVVPSGDKALTVEDLKGYEIYFGPEACDEKHAEAVKLFQELKVALPAKLTTCNSCSVGAVKILELSKSGAKAATVISNYAQPLLEGCGTIKKGELRVIGETESVPFITVFVNDAISGKSRDSIIAAFESVKADADLCKAMETKNGFVPIDTGKKK